MVERPSRNTRTDMEDDGGLLILLFSFLLLFHFSFSFLSFLCGAFFTTLFSSPSPTLLLNPIHLLFQKNRKGGQKKLFWQKRKGHTKKCVEDKKNKSGVEEKKKTQGMRRNLRHKGCGWVTLPALRKISTSVSVKISILV